MNETTTNLLILKVATTPEITSDSVSQHLSENIKGKECVFDDATFQTMVDVDRIKKVYKLGSVTSGKVDRTVTSSSTNLTASLEIQILGLIALRGAT